MNGSFGSRVAILGATGFVGRSLARQLSGADAFDSRTAHEAIGQTYVTVFCAAAPGSMLVANRTPERDAANLAAIAETLRGIGARRVVLISTIAVLDRFDGGRSESDAAYQTETPYGRHRRALEEAVVALPADTLIVRLPALYGPGLAKNFLFDLLHPVPTMLTAAWHDRLAAALPDHLARHLPRIYSWAADREMFVIDRAALDTTGDRTALEAAARAEGVSAIQFHHPETRHQFYGLHRLADDIARAVDAGLDVLHLAPAPVTNDAIHRAAFGAPMPATGARIHIEDMRTVHARHWGRDGPYIADADAVLRDVTAFLHRERRA